jgi:hypothetical protein
MPTALPALNLIAEPGYRCRVRSATCRKARQTLSIAHHHHPKKATMDHFKPLPLRQHRADKRERHFGPPIRPTPTEQSSIAAPQKPPSAGRAPALQPSWIPNFRPMRKLRSRRFARALTRCSQRPRR